MSPRARSAKVEADSYSSIALSLGVDSASDVLFATDNPAEASAAREAGMEAALVVRPGNKPLPPTLPSGVPVVHTLTELLK